LPEIEFPITFNEVFAKIGSFLRKSRKSAKALGAIAQLSSYKNTLICYYFFLKLAKKTTQILEENL